MYSRFSSRQKYPSGEDFAPPPPRGVQVKPEISYNTNFHPQCHFQSFTHAQGSHVILYFGAFSDNFITDFEFCTHFMQLWIGVRSQYVFWSI